MPKRRRGARTAARPPRGHAMHAGSSGSSSGRWPRSRRRSARRSTRSRSSSRTSRAASSGARTTSRDDETLYGLYEGVPRTEYGADWVAVPNRITLFRLPLEEDFPDPRDLADEVRITVIHELAHHLGIDDDRLDELGV